MDSPIFAFSTMDIRFAHALYSALRSDGQAFGYSGTFEDDITALLVDLGDSLLGAQDPASRSRLNFAMVEAYQNIVRHRIVGAGGVPGARSLFLVRHGAKGQQVVAMNPLRNEQAAGLGKRIEGLAALGRAELKELFLDILKRTQDPGQRGAGLGLVEMTRRSGNPLRHGFLPLPQDLMLFVLLVSLGEVPPDPLHFRTAQEVHALVVRHDLRFFHVGARAPGDMYAMQRLVSAEGHTCLFDSRGLDACTGALSAYGGTAAPGVLAVVGDRGVVAGVLLSGSTAGTFEQDALSGAGPMRSVHAALGSTVRTELLPTAEGVFACFGVELAV